MAIIEESWRDLREGARAIVRLPVLAGVVIASLGVGIGVNTAVFSWIQAIVFRPLPGVADAASFLLVEPRAETGSHPGASWPEYQDLRERVRALPDLLAFRLVPFAVGEMGRTERTSGLLVSGNYFSALGLSPAVGRLLRPADAARAGGEAVAVISYDYWQTRFGGSRSAVGRTLRVNDREITIVGVTRPGFQGTIVGLQSDLWLPATLAPVLLGGSRELEDRRLRGYYVIGRLREETTRAEAQAQFDAAMRHLSGTYPQSNAGMRGELLPFWRAPRGPQGTLLQGLAVLQGVLLLLLLAVCGNTANLVLARASSRQREIGIRLALGAARSRVIRLLLAENVVLGLAGAALGMAIAMWGTDALRAVRLSMAFPVRFQTSVDASGLAFAALLGLTCALLFGAAPALHLARTDPHVTLRAGARTAGRNPARNLLMGIEVALAVAVLLVAALFFRSFWETRDSDPGFRREGVLLAAYDLTGRNVNNDRARQFASRLLERLRALPSVEAAAIASSVPLDIHGLPLRAFTLEGRARSDAAPDRALTNTVTPGYFTTMGIPLRAGRDFADLDDVTAPPQAIVNEEFMRRYLQGAEPLGRRLEFRGRTLVISGVVRNSLYDSFGEPAMPFIYLSYRDRPIAAGEIHLRTRPGAELLLGPEVARAVRGIDPTLPTYNVRTLAQHVETNLFLRRIPARMFVVLGPLLLALAAVGIYAVVAYSVSHRSVEIGMRIALGATARRVTAQIVGETLRVVAVGVVVGWLMVVAVYTHLVRGGTLDLPVFAGVPAILLAVAAIACWLPARRAARVDPMLSLRQA